MPCSHEMGDAAILTSRNESPCAVSISSTSRAECALCAGDKGAQCSRFQGYELPEGSSSLWWDFSPSHTSEISPRV
jgi:hypothetical protein